MRDRFLSAHAKWYLREVRVNAYAQFLESYKSVTATSMATAFGVSVEFLDRELSRFIAVGRIHAKIDKVGCCLLLSMCATSPSHCPCFIRLLASLRQTAQTRKTRSTRYEKGASLVALLVLIL